MAGYSGGSSFVVERFVGVPNGAQWNSLWIDFTDRVSGKEVDFDRAGDAAVNACEQALDAVWEWNDNDVWGETDEVLLVPARQKALQVKGNMLYLASDVEPWVRSVCELAGLTAAPATK